MLNAMKRLVLRLLPVGVLKAYKKRRFARLVRNFDPADERDLAVVKHLVARGDHVGDLGANIGVYTRFLSEMVGPAGRVTSVEPIPLTYEMLCHCTEQLGLRNVQRINAAVSDTPGSVRMEVPLYDAGWENYYEAHVVTGAAGTNAVTVEAKRIDDLFAASPPVSFIKMDVEGHELSCLRGATATLERAQPAWLIEVSDDPDEPTAHASGVFQLLADRGYQAYWFDGSKVHKRRAGARSINYFFLAEKHVRALETAELLAERVAPLPTGAG